MRRNVRRPDKPRTGRSGGVKWTRSGSVDMNELNIQLGYCHTKPLSLTGQALTKAIRQPPRPTEVREIDCRTEDSQFALGRPSRASSGRVTSTTPHRFRMVIFGAALACAGPASRPHRAALREKLSAHREGDDGAENGAEKEVVRVVMCHRQARPTRSAAPELRAARRFAETSTRAV